jgi:hypothetical protein
MPGLFRTASNPSKTVMLEAPYVSSFAIAFILSYYNAVQTFAFFKKTICSITQILFIGKKKKRPGLTVTPDHSNVGGDCLVGGDAPAKYYRIPIL